MSKLNFYSWVRENVRRAVLLGFSDAVEELGAADAGEPISPHLAALLSERPNRLASAGALGVGDARSAPQKERRRLGRSLEQIQKASEDVE